MSVEEIFNSEKREKNNLFEIHFYLEGSFWRAYEWSAYLSRNFPSDLTEEERLRPIKKVTKNCEDGYIQIGLQLNSFEKYFPGVTNNEKLFNIKDKEIIIHGEDFFKDIEFNKYEDLLHSWKNSINLSNKEKKKFKNNKDFTENITIDDIIKEIISYPVENRSLIENLQFLSYIRDKINKIKKEK